MPDNCCVPLCCKTGYRLDSTGGKVTFHKLPKDPKKLKLWLVKIRRDVSHHFTINDRTRICSLHFISSDFKVSLAGRRFLRDDAVPSVFAWSSSEPKRKSPRKRQHPSWRDVGRDEEQLSPNSPPTPTADPDAPDVDETERLQAENQRLKMEKERLVRSVSELNKRKFVVENFRDSDSDICFYTGFPNFETLFCCFCFLNPGDEGQNILYVTGNDSQDFQIQRNVPPSSDDTKKGRKRKLSPLNEFFMVLVRLRLGLLEQDLAHRFGVHLSTVNRICISWINFMYLRFGYLNIWPDRESVDRAMPLSFREKYPSTRVIIDGTELKCQTPSSLVMHSETYSSYKSHTTFKGLIGISPSGHVTFVSQLYAGSISDREITIRSGLLRLPFNKGDTVMADKGFTIDDLLAPLGVKLNIPPFVGTKGQHSPGEVIATQEIASERIHVERAINKIKNFQIFNQVIHFQ